MSNERDGLQQIIDEVLESMAAEATGEFDPQTCNLAEFCRRTGLTRMNILYAHAVALWSYKLPAIELMALALV